MAAAVAGCGGGDEPQAACGQEPGAELYGVERGSSEAMVRALCRRADRLGLDDLAVAGKGRTGSR